MSVIAPEKIAAYRSPAVERFLEFLNTLVDASN